MNGSSEIGAENKLKCYSDSDAAGGQIYVQVNGRKRMRSFIVTSYHHIDVYICTFIWRNNDES